MLPTPPSSPKCAVARTAASPAETLALAPPVPAPPPADPPGDSVAARAGIGVTCAAPSRPDTQRRAMGDAEVAAFHLSRDGTGDLFAHANTPLPLTAVSTAWALLLVRHPVLASRVTASHLQYTRPDSAVAALAAAEARLTLHSPGPDDLLDTHLNGRRALASDLPAHLAVRAGLRDADLSGAGVPTERGSELLLIVAGHVADAAALHNLLAELLTLLSQPPAALQVTLHDEMRRPRPRPLPPPLEARLPLSSLQAAVGALVVQRAEARISTGPTFPLADGVPRVAVVPTRIYSREQSAAALARCATRALSLRAVLAALCAVAWARRQPSHLPISIALTRDIGSEDTCLASVAVAVTVPSLPLALVPAPELVWYRAAALERRLTRPRGHTCMPAARILGATGLAARRAVARARERDARAAAANPGLGLGIAMPVRAAPLPLEVRDPDTTPPPPAPRVLLALTVSETCYSAPVESVLVGARMGRGEVGVHAYIAAGKLTLSLAYDVNGFVWGAVEGWWAEVLALVNDVLLQ